MGETALSPVSSDLRTRLPEMAGNAFLTFPRREPSLTAASATLTRAVANRPSPGPQPWLAWWPASSYPLISGVREPGLSLTLAGWRRSDNPYLHLSL